jgi:hypothetical protein
VNRQQRRASERSTGKQRGRVTTLGPLDNDSKAQLLVHGSKAVQDAQKAGTWKPTNVVIVVLDMTEEEPSAVSIESAESAPGLIDKTFVDLGGSEWPSRKHTLSLLQANPPLGSYWLVGFIKRKTLDGKPTINAVALAQAYPPDGFAAESPRESAWVLKNVFEPALPKLRAKYQQEKPGAGTMLWIRAEHATEVKVPSHDAYQGEIVFLSYEDYVRLLKTHGAAQDQRTLDSLDRVRAKCPAHCMVVCIDVFHEGETTSEESYIVVERSVFEEGPLDIQS